MTDIKGICPIIAPPFTDDGEIDENSLRHMLRKLIEGGCHALTLFGFGGEFYKLSDKERHQLLDIVVEECREGGIPSIVSITQHATKLAVQEAKHAEAVGADCLMLLPPFLLRPTKTDLFQHIAAVGETVTIPIILQYAPHLTGVAIDPALMADLSNEFNTIQYFKIECKPPGPYISKLLELTDNKVKIMAGSAGLNLPEAFDRGAIGGMPGSSMFDLYLKVYESYMRGERDESIRLHNLLVPMINHILQRTEMIIYYEKRILKRRGFIESDHCRLPTFTPDEYYDRLFEDYYAMIKPHLG